MSLLIVAYSFETVSRRLTLAGWLTALLLVALTATANADQVNRKLSGVMPAFGDAEYSLISPDEQYAVYSADQDADEVYELYSVRLSGGTPVKLNLPLPPNTYVGVFQISPDSSRVVYRADQETDEIRELYSVPVGGGALPLKLNGPLVNGGDVAQYSARISPISGWVIYAADQEIDDVFELFISHDSALAPPVDPIYLPLITRE